jgi:hypothetical protein
MVGTRIAALTPGPSHLAAAMDHARSHQECQPELTRAVDTFDEAVEQSFA